MKKIIEYFSQKHILVNMIILAVLAGGVVFWNSTSKEDMPNINFDMTRINASYPGATAEEVDYHITGKIEEAIAGIDGIKSMESSSSQGSCSFFIELDPDSSNRPNVVDDIASAVNSISFPDEVEIPVVREFKSNQRAVMDLALYYRDIDVLTDDNRRNLQGFADTLESRLNRLRSVSDVEFGNYLSGYIDININPAQLVLYDISLQDVINVLKKSNLKQPVGTLKDSASTRLRLDADMNDLDRIRNIVIRDTFDGVFFRLVDIASVNRVFEDRSSVYKVNGSEAITLRITKTSSAGILVSTDEMKKVIEEFRKNVLADSGVELAIISDNSTDVRNRLSLITSNGILGFILIVLMLFVFLDAKSGFWVAMGIPFALASTMIIASLLGNTINNMTLAAVIIVIGMVVDDAIVAAENVNRLYGQGVPRARAVAEGTARVFVPILASITTTCVAFIPLFFFQGHFGILTRFLPPIIFLMLGSSLFEAIFILPSHLLAHFPRWAKIILSAGLYLLFEKRNAARKKSVNNAPAPSADNTYEESISTGESGLAHWFMKVEAVYGKILERLLKHKLVIFAVLIGLGIAAGFIFVTSMKFSIFPREESTEFFISGETDDAGMNKFRTEEKVREIEKLFEPYLGRDMVSYRTSIARSRRGSSVKENSFTLQIEIVPKEKQKKSAKQLNAEWEKMLAGLSGFKNLTLSRSHWGQSSGSPIDIIVQENDDKTRDKIADEILAYLKTMPSLKNAEIERELTRPQYILRLNKDVVYKLNINADTIAGTLRTVLQGSNVFDVIINGKDVDVIVSIDDKLKASLDSILSIPIRISSGVHVPLKKLVLVEKDNKPDTIRKLNGKRTLHVYADLNEKQKSASAGDQPGQKEGNGQQNGQSGKNSKQAVPEPGDKTGKNKSDKNTILDLPEKMTPIEIAQHLEENLFPALYRTYTASDISFGGEISDTRESSQDFQYAIIFTILFIYMILCLTLNSLTKPVIILLAIPFGCIGIIFALSLHGMLVYGFFSVVGALGLAGVIVNDSIVLLDKLDAEYNKPGHGNTIIERVANIAKTRLRAVLLTTFTTVAGLLPTAYGVFGYDSMLAEMMLTLAWGLLFGTFITLVMVPSLYCAGKELSARLGRIRKTA